MVLQAHRVQTLQAGDVAERLGIDARERLFREHPQPPNVLEARAGRRRHVPAVKVHRLCQLHVDSLLRSRDWPGTFYEGLGLSGKILIFLMFSIEDKILRLARIAS